jgi:hypothetical protein
MAVWSEETREDAEPTEEVALTRYLASVSAEEWNFREVLLYALAVRNEWKWCLCVIAFVILAPSAFSQVSADPPETLCSVKLRPQVSELAFEVAKAMNHDVVGLSE